MRRIVAGEHAPPELAGEEIVEHEQVDRAVPHGLPVAPQRVAGCWPQIGNGSSQCLDVGLFVYAHHQLAVFRPEPPSARSTRAPRQLWIRNPRPARDAITAPDAGVGRLLSGCGAPSRDAASRSGGARSRHAGPAPTSVPRPDLPQRAACTPVPRSARAARGERCRGQPLRGRSCSPAYRFRAKGRGHLRTQV